MRSPNAIKGKRKRDLPEWQLRYNREAALWYCLMHKPDKQRKEQADSHSEGEHKESFSLQIVGGATTIVVIVGTVLSLVGRAAGAIWVYAFAIILPLVGLVIWVHRNRRKRSGSILATSVIGAVLTIYGARFLTRNIVISVQPQLAQPSFPDKPEVVSLSLATNTFRVPTSDITNHEMVVFGPSEAGLPFNIEDLSPISFMLKNDEMFISTQLYQGASLPPVILRDNTLVDMPSGWDRNSNHSAFEVVDENVCPMFQFVRKTAFQAVITGSFIDRSGKRVFASENRVELGGKRADKCELTPLFMYPSGKYPGQLR